MTDDVGGRSDPDLLEPPAELWMRIADAVVVAAASPPGEPTVVEYRIDGDDVVIEVGGAWSDFADRNDAPELAHGGTGRTLWSAMGPGELSDLWREAVTRVRARGETATVPFRCDGPQARRWFELTITPEADGHLRFRSALVVEMERPDVAALRRTDRAPADDAVEVCSWCGEGRDGDDWAPVEEVLAHCGLLEHPEPGRVRFGLCPDCRDQVDRDLVDGSGLVDLSES